ncbi:MAG: hypothetical protein ACI9OJ_002143 [Myxococcota bacterium]
MCTMLVYTLLVSSAAHAEPPTDAMAGFGALENDSPGTNNSTHYLVSNERRPDLFYRHVTAEGAGRGGVYLGVGAEQNYILAAWARSEIIVLMDFDPVIVDLHAVHRAAFLTAVNPAGFVAFWTGSADIVRAALAQHVSDSAARKRALAAYELARESVGARLKEWSARSPGGKPTFLTDSKQYEFLVDRFRSGRVVATQGDLTGARAMASIARAIQKSGFALRVLYLSNAEQYFMFKAGYRRNILALPFDKKSLVLRTLPGRPRGFEYIVQSGENLHAWMGSRKTNSVYRIRGLNRGEHLIGETFYEVTRLPPTPLFARPRR